MTPFVTKKVSLVGQIHASILTFRQCLVDRWDVIFETEPSGRRQCSSSKQHQGRTLTIDGCDSKTTASQQP